MISPDHESRAVQGPEGVLADDLHSATLHLLRRLRRSDGRSGIGPARLSVLSVLVYGGAKTPGELARIEDVKPPTMSAIVAGLERDRLVRRRAFPGDGRRVVVAVTLAGRQLFSRARVARLDRLSRAIATLADDRQAMLRAAVPVIIELVRALDDRLNPDP